MCSLLHVKHRQNRISFIVTKCKTSVKGEAGAETIHVDCEKENERRRDETPSSGRRLEVKGVAYHRLTFH